MPGHLPGRLCDDMQHGTLLRGYDDADLQRRDPVMRPTALLDLRKLGRALRYGERWLWKHAELRAMPRRSNLLRQCVPGVVSAGQKQLLSRWRVPDTRSVSGARLLSPS